MSEVFTHCQYCGKEFTEEELKRKKKFCNPKEKAAYHRERPFKDALQVTVVESKTGKGGVYTTIRTDIKDRELHAKAMIPGKRMYLVPMIEDLIEG